MERFSRKSAADLAADQIRGAIVSGDLEMGAPISEAWIAEKLGTSRTPIRESFRQLAQEGLLLLRPYTGASVFQFSEAEACDFIDFRTVLELAALKMAFARGSTLLDSALTPIVDQMLVLVDHGDFRHYMAMDSAFHLAIVEAAESAHLREAYIRITSKAAAMRNLISKIPGRLDSSLAGHRAMLDSIRLNDLPRSESLLTQHLQNLKTVISDTFITDTPPVVHL